jgi:hypothetical protein
MELDRSFKYCTGKGPLDQIKVPEVDVQYGMALSAMTA